MGLPSFHSLSTEARLEISQDNAVFADNLAYVRLHGAGDVGGVFGPGSRHWLIYREPIILLGSFRAVLMQVAHPAVGAGVALTGAYHDDLVNRARRTFATMYQIIFGDMETAMGAARRLYNIHHRVRGIVGPENSTQLVGQAYRANDPELLYWVWATMYETSLLMYETFVRPLTAVEKQQYYDETILGQAVLGIPPDRHLPTLAEFDDYYTRMQAWCQLDAGKSACSIAHSLFNNPYTRLTTLDRVLTAALLPPRFRRAFGLPWERRQQRQYRRLAGLLRLLIRLVPAHLRAVPAYHQAKARVADSCQKRPSLYAQTIVFCHHSDRVRVPLIIEELPEPGGGEAVGA